eukprot:TRINITY_DN925_c1_g1_i1.p1 TRINITY_DN925_c1_g1~~TRINITY_DN925_c1_g1_i1.p1  ORF type:complete len:248 (-),score=3.09 TRINITY_DN925_c1_g1_i1:277-1020(-)
MKTSRTLAGLSPTKEERYVVIISPKQPLIIIDDMSVVVRKPRLWETEYMTVAGLRESIHMNYFNVIFISSKNSIVGDLHLVSGYSVLKSYQLVPPDDDTIAKYYESLGISDAKYLTSIIGLNFRFAYKIVSSNKTNSTALKGDNIFDNIIDWLNYKRMELTDKLRIDLGEEQFLEAKKLAQFSGDPENWNMTEVLKMALIKYNVLVQQGWYDSIISNEFIVGTITYHNQIIKHALLETQFQSLTQYS